MSERESGYFRFQDRDWDEANYTMRIFCHWLRLKGREVEYLRKENMRIRMTYKVHKAIRRGTGRVLLTGIEQELIIDACSWKRNCAQTYRDVSVHYQSQRKTRIKEPV